MGGPQSFGDHGESPDAVHAAMPDPSYVGSGAAPYPPEALARLRAALRAGLLPIAPVPPSRDDPPAEAAALPVVPPSVPDSLPEHTIYRDEGCHIAPACLRCPLERCIFDRPAHADAAVRRGRNRRLRGLARRGWPVARLARQFRLSPAHVRRILSAGPAASDQRDRESESPAAPDG
jgi:hypothetical protein